LIISDYFWLYGLVEPRTGESFFAEFSPVDAPCFEAYLKWFAQTYLEDLHIIQLDNGRLHTAAELDIPDNVILLFHPPYCPEVNPIERLWKEIKRALKWEIFENLEFLRMSLKKQLEKLAPETIRSLMEWDFIKTALSIANIY
jgi:transposase-like protein